jgi:Fic family protein
MEHSKADIEADVNAPTDRKESVAIMEPMILGSRSKHRAPLTDLALELARKSSGFIRSLPDGILTALADLVRSMNCYYSNLIEGHNTHPVDIERALKNDYSTDAKKRDLQLEAIAHITVQRWIDGGGLGNHAVTMDSILEIHRRFCVLLPDDLLWVTNPESGKRLKVIPGELRRHDVRVGTHIAIRPPAIPSFLHRFEEAYDDLGDTETLLAAAAAHHRLLWIHPFLDGNGRVARLMSHATLLATLNTGGVWSIARGLARDVENYKAWLAACDMPRRNDLDGSGSLSEENLAEFTRYFLTTCIDQIAFMESLMQPDRLRARIVIWAEEEARVGELPEKSGAILEAALRRGNIPRGEVAAMVGTGDRQARRIVAALSAKGVLVSASTRAPLRLAFPAALASRWMPGLFPDQAG